MVPERRPDSAEPFAIVRVVDDRDGRTVAGADVRYLIASAITAEDRARRQHVAEHVERNGIAARTDERGRVGLPGFERHLYVVAWRDGRFGYRMLRERDAGKRALELRLRADVTLTAEVRGPNGPEADFDVVLCELRGKKGVRTTVSRATDGEGRLRIRHLQLYGDKQWLLTPWAPFDPAPYVTFTTAEAAKQVWRLRVPAVGTLALRIVGPSRKPLRASASASLGLQRRLQWKVGNTEVEVGGWSARRVPGSGDLVFHPVGLGLRFRASVRVDRARTRTTIEGPAVPGERRVVDVVLESETTVLAGTAEPGRPLRAYLLGPAGWRMSHTPVLDGEGRFELAFEPRTPAGDYELYLVDRRTGAQLRVAIPGLRQGDHRDLGELRLAIPEPLVAGRVADDAGEPIRGARLGVERLEADTTRWRSLSFAFGTSRADGTFAIPALRAPGTLRLHVTAAGHIPRDVTISGRENGLVVQLDRAAQLELSALVPAGFRDRLTAELHGGGERRTPAPRKKQSRPRKGRIAWTFRGVPRGRYQLRVLYVSASGPLWQRSLQLPPGTTDLGEALDLRSRIHRYEVVLRAGGAPAEPEAKLRGHLFLRDGDRSLKQVRVGSKPVVFHWPGPSVDCDLVGPGMRPRRVTLTPGSHVLEVARGARVKLELPGLGAALGETQGWIVARPVRQNTELSSQAWGYVRNNWGRLHGDTSVLTVGAAGAYDVVTRVSRPFRAGTLQRPLGRGRVVEAVLGRIEIQGDGTHRIPIDVEKVRATLR